MGREGGGVHNMARQMGRWSNCRVNRMRLAWKHAGDREVMGPSGGPVHADSPSVLTEFTNGKGGVAAQAESNVTTPLPLGKLPWVTLVVQLGGQPLRGQVGVSREEVNFAEGGRSWPRPGTSREGQLTGAHSPSWEGSERNGGEGANLSARGRTVTIEGSRRGPLISLRQAKECLNYPLAVAKESPNGT